MEPEFTKNGCKVDNNALKRPKWLPDSSQDHFGPMMVTSLGGFLGPLGVPKINQKSTFSENGWSKERFFIDFCGKCWFSRFVGGFLVGLPLNIDEKQTCFVTTARVFFKLATPTKHCILRYESYFFVF